MADRIARLRVRGILESRGRTTVEATVVLGDGAEGAGSAPVAIAPGRREARPSRGWPLGPVDGGAAAWVRDALEGCAFESQDELDAALRALRAGPIAAHGPDSTDGPAGVGTVGADGPAGAGADLTLAASLAFCRAVARSRRRPLYQHLATLAGTEPAVPHLLANLFSGGIHDGAGRGGFQNVMLSPMLATLVEEIGAVTTIHDAVEADLRARGMVPVHSASSGIALPDVGSEAAVAAASDHVERAGFRRGQVRLGVDAAAEHRAAGPDRYRLDGVVVDADELQILHERLVERFDVGFLEDPFDPEDTVRWRAATATLGDRACVAGDDLFATDPDRIDPSLANGIVLKLSQAGTVSATLAAARAAAEAGLRLCVSHRSGETEDTATCHLAVAVAAEFVKVGGPRRGDRTIRYNELLRLAERLPRDRRGA
jgi:enolase